MFGEDEEEPALNLKTEKLEPSGRRNLEFKKNKRGPQILLKSQRDRASKPSVLVLS